MGKGGEWNLHHAVGISKHTATIMDPPSWIYCFSPEFPKATKTDKKMT